MAKGRCLQPVRTQTHIHGALTHTHCSKLPLPLMTSWLVYLPLPLSLSLCPFISVYFRFYTLEVGIMLIMAK